jgi:integrase
MPKPLTPIAIANLKPKLKRFEISDPGCPGLRIVVFPSRRKSFVCRFRFRGLQRKLTLGPCLTERGVAESDTAPEAVTPLSLAAARQLATTALREAKSGIDPCAAKRKQRQEQIAAEGDTLGAIAAEFLRREGPRLRSLNQRKSDLDLVCASLGRLPVASISRGMFTRVVDGINDNNGPVRADRVLSALRTLLNWHANRSDFITPLVRGARRPSTRKRERVLDDSELQAVWRTAEQDEGPFGSFVRFTLLTAARRGESAGLRRAELSDGGKVWTIPASRYKSNRDMLVPLSEAAARIVAAMPVLAGGDHLFSADGSHPLNGFDDRKKAFDTISGVSDWRLHDLRRTARTLLSKCPGVTPDIAERCLGHSLPGLRATYDRHEYATEKAAAFEKLAALIEHIVDPRSGNVLPMTKARRK